MSGPYGPTGSTRHNLRQLPAGEGLFFSTTALQILFIVSGGGWRHELLSLSAHGVYTTTGGNRQQKGKSRFTRVRRYAMKTSLNRRRFLAAAAAGSVLGALGKGALAGDNPGESRLFLPTRSGGATGVKFAPTPSWARDTPGWFLPNTISAGSCMLAFEPVWIESSHLKSFRDLPRLLTQAKSLGTEAIYLVDWYEGLPGSPPYNWWSNKGDYIPRSDQGGAAALKDGIAAVHALGGRIIFYIEGFIIQKASNVGKRHGADWSIMVPGGPLAHPYSDCWKPCPAAKGWVEYFESVARRMGQDGADGLFIDSYGYQRDYKCVSRRHGHPIGSGEVFNAGAARLLRRARAALQSERPEAILLTEGPLLKELFEHTDGFSRLGHPKPGPALAVGRPGKDRYDHDGLFDRRLAPDPGHRRQTRLPRTLSPASAQLLRDCAA